MTATTPYAKPRVLASGYDTRCGLRGSLYVQKVYYGVKVSCPAIEKALGVEDRESQLSSLRNTLEPYDVEVLFYSNEDAFFVGTRCQEDVLDAYPSKVKHKVLDALGDDFVGLEDEFGFMRVS
jgi:hypothetical protein